MASQVCFRMSVSMSSESKPLSVKRSNKAASKAQRDLSMRSANVVERSAVMTNRTVLEKSL